MDFLLNDVYLPGHANHDDKTKKNGGHSGRDSNGNGIGHLPTSLLRRLRDSGATKDGPRYAANAAAQSPDNNEWKKQVLCLKLGQVRLNDRSQCGCVLYLYRALMMLTDTTITGQVLYRLVGGRFRTRQSRVQ